MNFVVSGNNPIHSMKTFSFTQEQLIQVAKLTDKDIKKINDCRRDHNKLGFGYQLCFVKLFNRFPLQERFQVIPEIATYAGVQLDLQPELIEKYQERQPTISGHRAKIEQYLGLSNLNARSWSGLEDFLFQESLQIEAIDSLLYKATEFLKENHLLNPTEKRLKRLIREQREKARVYIFNQLSKRLPPTVKEKLDNLLLVDDGIHSPLNFIKETPKNPSESTLKMLAERLRLITSTGVLDIDLSWINNNYRRYLSTYARRSDANILKVIVAPHRYAALSCFLLDSHQDTIDYLFDTYTKAVNKVITSADNAVEAFNRAKRGSTRSLLSNHKHLCRVLIELQDGNSDVQSLFRQFPKTNLEAQIEEVETLLSGKYSNNLNLMAERFSYLRKLARLLLNNLEFEVEATGSESLLEALMIVSNLMSDKIRKVPLDAPMDFLLKKTQKAIGRGGQIDRSKYETAIYTAIPEQVQCGNLSIKGSKRFGRFDDFFIEDDQWGAIREDFFKKSKLPQNPNDVEEYLTSRLNQAYDYFLEREPDNKFAKAGQDGWTVSVDSGESWSLKQKEDLYKLKQWLGQNMRTNKLPDLLIEVDNDLHFTDCFLPASKRGRRTPDEICKTLITLMAYGCNIGPKIMPELIKGISYRQIKRRFDWQFTFETLRQALALIVNGISNVEITKQWGEGKTSASDGQRFSYRRKTIHQTFSHKFNALALEFYTFVADNFAPYYNLAKEATDRDSSKILDGHLYNVSDLEIEEHYTDTHGYTEINFAACAMLGITFSPRIRNIKKQRIYKIDEQRNYGNLKHLVKDKDRTVKMKHIVDNWDRMAQFYASFKKGKMTASTGLKRLTALNSKNNFYKANLWLGRILKTEHILFWMSDPFKRKNTRTGLLKVEQVHALARDILFGNRGRLKGKDLEEHTSSANCLTIIIAAIVYWQAKEMSRIIEECDPEAAGINIELIKHVSPVEWSNVILYGEYKLNRELIRE